MSLNYVRERRRLALCALANEILIWWLLCWRKGNRRLSFVKWLFISCIAGLQPGGEHFLWSLWQETAQRPHILKLLLSQNNIPLKSFWPIYFQTKWNVGIVCLCVRAHLQEHNLGGDVSVKLASLWLVEAAHPTRLRCFLWACGGRSCHSSQVSFNSDYSLAFSLWKPPLLLINDTLKEIHSNAPLPHTET